MSSKFVAESLVGNDSCLWHWCALRAGTRLRPRARRTEHKVEPGQDWICLHWNILIQTFQTGDLPYIDTWPNCECSLKWTLLMDKNLGCLIQLLIFLEKKIRRQSQQNKHFYQIWSHRKGLARFTIFGLNWLRASFSGWSLNRVKRIAQKIAFLKKWRKNRLSQQQHPRLCVTSNCVKIISFGGFHKGQTFDAAKRPDEMTNVHLIIVALIISMTH